MTASPCWGPATAPSRRLLATPPSAIASVSASLSRRPREQETAARARGQSFIVPAPVFRCEHAGYPLRAKAEARLASARVPLRSSTRRLIPPVRLLGPPGVAQAGAGREPDPCRSVQISVALGVSCSLALALVLDHWGSDVRVWFGQGTC
jgi:hypothetical protein